MPDPRPLTGLYGKVPAHGDFVRRGLPSSFVAPWDSWLAAGIATARGQLGAQWEGAWDSAPAWRFALPPGACGPDAVAGVMLPSQDQVGRRFPITLAALLPPAAPPPDAEWFDALEAAALAGLAGRADADALAAALPVPGAPILVHPFALPPILPATAPRQDDAPAPWPANDAPPAFSDPAHPDQDVLALLAVPAAPLPTGHDDDALALLIGSAAPPPETAPALDPDGTLAGLIGVGAGAPPPHRADLPVEADGGTLAALIGTSAEAASAPSPSLPEGDDGTLAALIDAPAEPASALPSASDGGDGILAGLIGAGTEAPVPGAAEPPPALALIGGDAAPASADGPDLLPETVSMGWPDLTETADAAPAIDLSAAAPPAPEGGGWWTRGGAHVPPMVWPLPGLPDPADFAYLLEAAA